MDALARDSEEFSALLSQGTSAVAAGNRRDAIALFQRARELKPNDADVNYYLAYLAEQDGDKLEAETYYREAIQLNQSMRQAYVQLAQILDTQGRSGDVLSVLREAEQVFPEDREILYRRGQVASTLSPGWHLPMLADQERNDLYEAAISRQVKAGDIVLDIGTGSGLLAMMAARAGAKHVYACECDPTLVALAKEIIQRNGFQDRITLIAKHSSQIVIGEDLPEKADVLVTEIFDRALVGEGMLPTLAHAQLHLLKPDARIIPQGARLHGVVVECPQFHRFHKVDQVNGFDLTPMNMLAHPMAYKDGLINLNDPGGREILTSPFEVKSFDFHKPLSQTFRSVNEVEVVVDGQADAVLMWFDLILDDGLVFSTRNTQSHNHWRQATQIILNRPQLTVGQSLRVRADYFGYFDFILSS